MDFPQPVPSEQTDAGVMARQLAQLLGPAYQAGDGSFVAQELLALGGVLSGYPWSGVVQISGTNGATVTFGSSVLLINGITYGAFTNPQSPYAAITSVALGGVSDNSPGKAWVGVTATKYTGLSLTDRVAGDVMTWSSTPTNANATATVIGANTDVSQSTGPHVPSVIANPTITASAPQGRNTNLYAIREAFVDTAVALLTELEVEYGLQVRTDLSIAARQNRLLAKLRAKFSGTPQDINTSVALLPSSYKLVEIAATAITPSEYGGSPITPYYRNTMNFNIVVAAGDFTYAGALGLTMQSMETVLEQMKPAQTSYVITTNDVSSVNGGFVTSNSFSLTDRNVIRT
jgi:hypothetical protein